MLGIIQKTKKKLQGLQFTVELDLLICFDKNWKEQRIFCTRKKDIKLNYRNVYYYIT